MTFRFPGESDEYRQARDELLEAEVALRRQIDAVAAQRRRLPLGGALPRDYAFEERDPGTGAAREVRLSELFENGKEGPRHVDFMWPLWAILDRTPEGRDSDWMPQLRYR